MERFCASTEVKRLMTKSSSDMVNAMIRPETTPGMNPHLYEAALDLGATPIQAIRRVLIPEIMPGVVSGLIMAFTMSLDDFVISRFTSVEAQNLSMLIYSRTRTGVDPTINALSAIMFVCVISLLLIANRKSLTADSKKDKKHA